MVQIVSIVWFCNNWRLVNLDIKIYIIVIKTIIVIEVTTIITRWCKKVSCCMAELALSWKDIIDQVEISQIFNVNIFG